MIVVNGIATCDSCRKALRALADAGRCARLRDLRADPASDRELAAWHALFGATLVNTRSTTWRGLSDGERAQAPLALLRAHPTLVKRPLVVAGDAVWLGWTPATRAALGL